MKADKLATRLKVKCKNISRKFKQRLNRKRKGVNIIPYSAKGILLVMYSFCLHVYTQASTKTV